MHKTAFETVIIEHRVAGKQADVSALAYDLQYTKDLVSDMVCANPVISREVRHVHFGSDQLVRVNLQGADLSTPSKRACAVGIGQDLQSAGAAAEQAWFDYHASRLFAEGMPDSQAFTQVFRQWLPGASVARAKPIGVSCELPEVLKPHVEAAVSRNMPTHDETEVLHPGELTVMRVNLYGNHPLEYGRKICVVGFGDRHYRAINAAEHAWKAYHGQLLLNARALSALNPVAR